MLRQFGISFKLRFAVFSVPTEVNNQCKWTDFKPVLNPQHGQRGGGLWRGL